MKRTTTTMTSSLDLAFVAGALFGPLHSIVYHIVSGHSRGCYLCSILDHTCLARNEVQFCLHDLHRAGFIEPIDFTFLSWRVNPCFRIRDHCSSEWTERIRTHVMVARKTKLISSVLSRSQLRNSLRKRRRNLSHKH